MPKGRTGRPRGRPPGALNKTTEERDAAIAEAQARARTELTKEQIRSLTPLDVMLRAMHLEVENGAWSRAAIMAEKAAPYIHAKLASEVHRVINDDSQREAEELRRELAEIDRAEKAAIAAGAVAQKVQDESDGVVH